MTIGENENKINENSRRIKSYNPDDDKNSSGRSFLRKPLQNVEIIG